MLCHSDLVDVEVLPPISQALSVVVRRKNEINWFFTALYASPNPRSRKELWDSLAGVAEGLPLPWLVAGDLNEVAASGEKQGGAPVNQRRFGRFLNFIDKWLLIDLGRTQIYLG